MDLGLSGKRAIVTGGTRGIGRAIVETLAAEGSAVALCSRNAAAVKETIAALEEKDATAHGRALDVADGAAYAEWLAEAADALGGVDIFIPNVSAGAVTTGGDEPWRRSLEVDVLHTVRGCETLLPHLARSSAASVVIVATVAAVETFIASTAYGACKAALLTYAKQWGQDVAAEGVRVNAVSPGPVYWRDGDWGRVEREMPDLFKQVADRCVLGRMARPEDVARAVAFLASPAAAAITGTNLVVDAGFTQRVQF